MKSSTARTYNKEAHHAEVAKVLFILLYGEMSKEFRKDSVVVVDSIVSHIRAYDGRVGHPDAPYPYTAIRNYDMPHGKRLFQQLGINPARMVRMDKLLSTGVLGFDILGLDDFADLYRAILQDLVDIGVL